MSSELLQIIVGDCRKTLKAIPDCSVQCCVTSPPYWGLRDYGHPKQIGLEKTFGKFLANLMRVFDEVHRILTPDGTLWVNMGDSYASSGGAGIQGKNGDRSGRAHTQRNLLGKSAANGIKGKDLMGQPWRLAFALRRRGWYLRQDIIWHKPNPMPESVSDRFTKAHEYLFLLSKSDRYFYDAKAICEPSSGTAHARGSGVNKKIKSPSGWDTGEGSHGNIHKTGRARPKQNASFSAAVNELVDERNKRSVWTVPTQACSDAHFATFPEALILPCVLAGSRPGDSVLDPFGGSGTTAKVAIENGRRALICEVVPAYIPLIESRARTTVGLGI